MGTLCILFVIYFQEALSWKAYGIPIFINPIVKIRVMEWQHTQGWNKN